MSGEACGPRGMRGEAYGEEAAAADRGVTARESQLRTSGRGSLCIRRRGVRSRDGGGKHENDAVAVRGERFCDTEVPVITRLGGGAPGARGGFGFALASGNFWIRSSCTVAASTISASRRAFLAAIRAASARACARRPSYRPAPWRGSMLPTSRSIDARRPRGSGCGSVVKSGCGCGVGDGGGDGSATTTTMYTLLEYLQARPKGKELTE